MGYAIGHYSRWVKPGAIRVESSSNDPLLLVTAFLDTTHKRLGSMVINNFPATQTVQFDLKNIDIVNSLSGERSTDEGTYPTSYWKALEAWQPESRQAFTVVLPA